MQKQSAEWQPYARMKIDYCQTTFIGMARFLLWAVKNPDRDFRQSGFPVSEAAQSFAAAIRQIL